MLIWRFCLYFNLSLKSFYSFLSSEMAFRCSALTAFSGLHMWICSESSPSYQMSSPEGSVRKCLFKFTQCWFNSLNSLIFFVINSLGSNCWFFYLRGLDKSLRAFNRARVLRSTVNAVRMESIQHISFSLTFFFFSPSLLVPTAVRSGPLCSETHLPCWITTFAY